MGAGEVVLNVVGDSLGLAMGFEVGAAVGAFVVIITVVVIFPTAAVAFTKLDRTVSFTKAPLRSSAITSFVTFWRVFTNSPVANDVIMVFFMLSDKVEFAI